MLFIVKFLFVVHIFTIYPIFLHECKVQGRTQLSNPFPGKENSPAIIAVLLECPMRIHPHPSSKTKPCENQILVNIRVHPSSETDTADKFLVLDEVYRAKKRKKVKILSPYLIHVTRGEPVMMYPLQYTKNRKINQKTPFEHIKASTLPTICCKKLGSESNDGNNKCGGGNSQAGHIKCGDSKMKFGKCGPPTESKDNNYPRYVGNSMKGSNSNVGYQRSRLRFINKLRCGSGNGESSLYSTNYPSPNEFNSAPLRSNFGNYSNIQSYQQDVSEYNKNDIGAAYPASVTSSNVQPMFSKTGGSSAQLKPQSEDQLFRQPYFGNQKPADRNMMVTEFQYNEADRIPHRRYENMRDNFNKFQYSPNRYRTELDELVNVQGRSSIPGFNKYKPELFNYGENDYLREENADSGRLKNLANIKLKEANIKRMKNEYRKSIMQQADLSKNYYDSRYFTGNEKHKRSYYELPEELKQSQNLNSAMEENGDVMLPELGSEKLVRATDPGEMKKVKIEPEVLSNDFLRTANIMHYESGIKGQYQKTNYMYVNPTQKLVVQTTENPRPASFNVKDKSAGNADTFYGDKNENILNKPFYTERVDKLKDIPSKYLVNRPPLSEIMEDRNISTDEKLRLMKLNENHNFFRDHMLDKFAKENLMPYNAGTPAPHQLKQNTILNKNPLNTKRNALKNKEQSGASDAEINMSALRRNTATREYVANNARSRKNDDAQPCTTCGGKNKKPPDKDKPKLNLERQSNNPLELENMDFNELYETVEDTIKRVNDEIHACETVGSANAVDKVEPAQQTKDIGYNANDAEADVKVPLANDKMLGLKRNELPCRRCYQKNYDANGVETNAENVNCNCRQVKSSCNCHEMKSSRETESGVNYLEFKMNSPLPLLAAKIRVYRKRFGAFWRIAPELTLDSFSGVYSNENLTIIFTAHVDIYQLQKSARMKNVKILLPGEGSLITPNLFESYNTFNENPNLILAYDNSMVDRFNRRNKFVRENEFYITGQDEENDFGDSTAAVYQNIEMFGMKPKLSKILEPCRNDKNQMCLNIVDDKVPEYVMKIKMPFRENAVIDPGILAAKIATVVTDATTKDVLQVSVDVINRGVEARKFTITISKCPMKYVSTARTIVTRRLAPFIRETVVFLLPLIDPNHKHKKFTCTVRVKGTVHSNQRWDDDDRKRRKCSDTQKLVAERTINIEPGSRCLCVWKCKCHCVPRLETHVDFNLCQPMEIEKQARAGLISSCNSLDVACPPGEKRPDTTSFYKLLRSSLIMSSVMLLLGLIKALLGLAGWRGIDKLGYDCIQPRKKYECSSRCRRFFFNTLFFLMYPLASWSYCCLRTEEDRLISTTEWACNRKNRARNSKTNSKAEKSKPCSSASKSDNLPRSKGGFSGYNDETSETRFSAHNSLFDEFDDEDENTRYVLQILDESRSSLKSLMNEHLSNDALCADVEEPVPEEAAQYVESLQVARIVYRILNQPIGNVQKIPKNVQYCVQGYFLQGIGTAFEFTNYYPLYQHRCFSPEGDAVKALYPPFLLRQDTFKRTYRNKIEVYEVHDLDLQPPENIECINITTMASLATSMLSLTSGLQNSGLSQNRSEEYNLHVPDPDE